MPRPGDNKFSFDSPHCSFDLAFGYGYTGSPDVVKAMTLHADRETKLNVLMGAHTGFITGHFENMQVFLSAWVAEHLRDIRSDQGGQSDESWKKDTHAFVGAPVTSIIEKSKYPVEAAKVMLLKMEPAERQETLDYLLRFASARKNAAVVQAVLEAGADPNTMGGIAVKNAFDGEPLDVTSLRALHKKGADFAKAGGTWSLDAAVLKTWDERLAKEETDAALDAFRQQAGELTAEVRELRERLKKYEPDAPKPPAPPANDDAKPQDKPEKPHGAPNAPKPPAAP